MGRSRWRGARLLVALAATAALAAGCGGDDDDDGSGSVDNAVELSGRIDQKGPAFQGYGVVTRLDGVNSSALTVGGGSEITAKDALLTFVFDTELTSRAIVGDSFSVATSGKVTFYLDDAPAAKFGDPESFSEAGEEVATGELRVTNVVTVYAPNRGIATATGSLELEDSSSFDLGGTEAEIGESGDKFRVTLTGRGIRTDALIPESNFDFAGQLVLDG